MAITWSGYARDRLQKDLLAVLLPQNKVKQGKTQLLRRHESVLLGPGTQLSSLLVRLLFLFWGLEFYHSGSCYWPCSRGWLFLGWLFGWASLRVEGIGAEGLALQFLGFALLLVPGGGGCLFRAGALLAQPKKVCVGETLLFGSNNYLLGFGYLVSSLVFVLVFVLGVPFFNWGRRV